MATARPAVYSHAGLGFSRFRQRGKLGDSQPIAIHSHPKPILAEYEVMAKPHRGHTKANHGKRPANAKARKAKRRKVRT
jgi:hypothetical protein